MQTNDLLELFRKVWIYLLIAAGLTVVEIFYVPPQGIHIWALLCDACGPH